MARRLKRCRAEEPVKKVQMIKPGELKAKYRIVCVYMQINVGLVLPKKTNKQTKKASVFLLRTLRD